MNEETQPPPPDDVPAILWLLLAFLPAGLGILFLHIPRASGLFPELLFVNFICCLFGAGKLARRIKNSEARMLVAFFLFCFFFGFNALTVLFIGCSGMGRIAP